MDKYKKSLDLLDIFLKETSKEDLVKMINKTKELNIKGPTFEEYLKIANKMKNN